ncbi:MAG: tektin family protein [Candidatus Muirbacterium halophilum]|nr:tektin family protein [Candidatus Muirbacterium halophilum]MCK9475452.1 tektin family protein [Candidatus Muirbacterium halophilum]
MRTRSSSLMEKTIFYALGLFFIVVMFITTGLIVNGFSKKINEINQAKSERENQKIRLETDIAQLKNDLQRLDIEIEKAIDKRGKEEVEYKEILTKLNEAKNYLPHAYIKPDIMDQIIKKLEELNLRIGYLVEKKIEYFSVDFSSVSFLLEISGDYFRIKKFLFFLENPLKIEDPKSGMIWNVVLKVPYPDGVNFYRFTRDIKAFNEKPQIDVIEKVISPEIYFSDINSKIIKIEKQKVPAANNATGARNTAQNQPVEIEVKKVDENLLRNTLSEEFLYLNSYKDSTLKMNIEIKTFFITEKE